MTHRRAWTACYIVASLLAVGACAHRADGRGQLGGLPFASASTSAGPTPAPVPSNTVGRSGATGPANGHSASASPSPEPGNSSFNIRQVSEDFSITLDHDPQTGRPTCMWADLGNGSNAIGVLVTAAHVGGLPLRQPTMVSFRIADDQGDHITDSTAFQQLLANLPVAPRQAAFSLTLTVSAVLAHPDSDPTDDQVSVRVSVPAGAGARPNFAPIDCTAN
ncbi:MAG TPA: hypothetical protein VKB59_16595 [Micromonosporaceae bacterium]|nr:hypothetical protein [Micromonosporaceae bacterium]